MRNKKLNIELYKKIYLIRKTEEVIIENYNNDEMKTPMHMSMGSESIAAGVCLALGTKHQAFGTYRSHALYLAKTGETDQFLAEMYGKITGAVKGKGGSMHILAPSDGLLGVSAIVASTIPVAVGAAYANKLAKNNKVVAVFFGDGAIDEGVFWESINIASLKKLPVIFVCEDNGYAVHTPGHMRHGYKSLTDIVAKFHCQVFKEETTDPEIIYELTQKSIKFIKKHQVPVLLHLRYYRYLEHVGINEDYQAGYRDRKELEHWLKIDPVSLQRNKLLKLEVNEEEIIKLEMLINKQIQKSLIAAQKAPFPTKRELEKYVFYEN